MWKKNSSTGCGGCIGLTSRTVGERALGFFPLAESVSTPKDPVKESLYIPTYKEGPPKKGMEKKRTKKGYITRKH